VTTGFSSATLRTAIMISCDAATVPPGESILRMIAFTLSSSRAWLSWSSTYSGVIPLVPAITSSR